MVARGPSLRLLPRLDQENRFFWTSGHDGVLRFLGCERCKRLVHPPTPRCPYCLSATLRPTPVSGQASLASYTVNEHPWIPGSDPYVIGLVAFAEDEQVRLMTNLVEVEVVDLHIGLELEVTFEHHDDVYLPLFRPADPARRSRAPSPGPDADGGSDQGARP